jgi:pimeloyl-ACP methyl ester carboxylesterase
LVKPFFSPQYPRFFQLLNNVFFMKNLIIALFILLSIQTNAQQTVAKIDTGALDGVHYKIIFPTNWKGKLVMYAHGREFIGGVPMSKNPDWVKRMTPFWERGYAVAASDYRKQGFALVEGVDDTETLRAYFFKTYGKPDSTFITGHSMGGGIALATMENFDQNYNGALSMCPLSSRPFLQCRFAFDIYATFEALFPNLVKPLADILDPSKNNPPLESAAKAAAKGKELNLAIIEKDPILAMALAQKFDIQLKDLGMSVLFSADIIRDVVTQMKGNPFDNTNTIYTGFPNNLDLNKKVARFSANVDNNLMFAKYDRTGNIGKPTVLLHSIYDPLIPSQLAVVNFENMVHKMSKSQFLTVEYTGGQAHCTFTAEETGKAFDTLRTWLRTGTKAKPQFVEK